MKLKYILCVFVAALLLLGASAPEQARNIYIGDIITLDVTGFSGDSLLASFRDFDIVDIQEEPDGGVRLSLRAFAPGEYNIRLGSQELLIDVHSTLDDIQREDLFEGDVQVTGSALPFHWRFLFYIAVGISILSGAFLLLKTLQRKRIKPLVPLLDFLRRSGALSREDDNYFVDLTRFFKEYLEAVYATHIIGKTSVEIMRELNGIAVLSPFLPEIQSWLIECDRLKFTGVSVSGDDKQALYDSLLDIVQRIDARKEEAA